jgi:hypothetical protein
MAWVGALGASVLTFFGGSGAVGLGSFLVGGAIVGAATGALYSAVTGGNIGKGVLYGALGGAALAYGGASLAGYSWGGGATTASGVSIPATAHGGTISQNMSGILASGAPSPAVANALTPTTGGAMAKLFTGQSFQGLGNVSSLGAAFLYGGQMGADREAEAELRKEELAEKKRQFNQQLSESKRQADQSYAASMERIKSSEDVAANELSERARQFDEQFGFEKYKYEDIKAEEAARREAREQGILDAAEYIRGEQKTATVSGGRGRRQLPGPVWYRNQKNQADAVRQQQQGTILQTGQTAAA